jgi:hypothetical protein
MACAGFDACQTWQLGVAALTLRDSLFGPLDVPFEDRDHRFSSEVGESSKGSVPTKSTKPALHVLLHGGVLRL